MRETSTPSDAAMLYKSQMVIGGNQRTCDRDDVTTLVAPAEASHSIEDDAPACVPGRKQHVQDQVNTYEQHRIWNPIQ